MVFKVAGAVQSLRKAWNLINNDDTDVSLAAFGRKEIEIAEVYFLHSVPELDQWLISERCRMKCQVSYTSGRRCNHPSSSAKYRQTDLYLISVHGFSAFERRTYRWLLAHVRLTNMY